VCFLSCNNNKEDDNNNASDKKGTTANAVAVKTIIFYGNSLTAGYGLEDPAQSFPGIIQKKIDSLQLPYRVVNAGVSGETTAGGNSRIDWILKQPIDIFVLELGANDGLRGFPVNETRNNLQAIVDKVKKKYPEAQLVLAGMLIPPNMGQQYSSDFKQIFPELAKKNNMLLIPFLLEGVGGETRFNQQDGIHPTAEGHKMIAETVWSYLKTIL
jgi:acyl-CoA thioesterase-1